LKACQAQLRFFFTVKLYLVELTPPICSRAKPGTGTRESLRRHKTASLAILDFPGAGFLFRKSG